MFEKQTFARYPGYVQFKLVNDPSECPGWDILDIIVADSIVSRQEAIGVSAGVPSTSGCGYSAYPGPVEGNRQFVVREALFLMGLPEKSAVNDLQAKIEKLNAKVAENVVALAEAEKTKRMAEELATKNDYLDKRINEEKNNAAVARNERAKMEMDLGKLRRVFGEKAFKEALEQP